MDTSKKLLVLVGPTASGKSALAMQLAEQLHSEIICADSRTVYKGLDIGTAKPSREDQLRIPHHLLDIVEPDQSFTAADFKQLANQAIDDIKSRNHLPILVGGSGMYIDAVLFDYGFSAVDSPRDETNPRHVSKDAPRLQKPLRDDAVVFGIAVPRDVLKQRIADRIDDMLAAGFIDEVKHLQAEYPASKALHAPGYKAFSEHIAGHLSIEEAKALFIKNDFMLAKRQMTWFRRNKNIHWLTDPNTSVMVIMELLNKLH